MTKLESHAPDPSTDNQATATFVALESSVAAVVATTPGTIRLAVACVAAGGHLLVEDHPGLGKTTLAKALAGALGLGFHRLQCTADLLPADVVALPCSGLTGPNRPSDPDPSSPMCSWPTSSIGRRPDPSPLSSKPWRSTR